MTLTACVTGAAGFIGQHLVSDLKRRGLTVRGVDLRRPPHVDDADEFLELDLRSPEACRRALADVEQVYALAADMGGMGYISAHHARILRDNALIDLHTLEAARQAGVRRLLYSSSACVYPEARQGRPDVAGLREEEAYPADPQDAYGWEKLTAERLCAHYREDHGLETRVARLHNVYGPLGTWEGGREKAPAALCRKVAVALGRGERALEVWGDGRQTRSFLYIDDCLEGLARLMASDHQAPLNLGSDRLVSVDELARLVCAAAGVELDLVHVDGPQGVRGRNSDNTRSAAVLGWAPRVTLEDGLARTYAWVAAQVRSGEMVGGGRTAGPPNGAL